MDNLEVTSIQAVEKPDERSLIHIIRYVCLSHSESLSSEQCWKQSDKISWSNLWDNFPEAYLILYLFGNLGLFHTFKKFKRLLEGKYTQAGSYLKQFTEHNLLKGLFTKMWTELKETTGMQRHSGTSKSLSDLSDPRHWRARWRKVLWDPGEGLWSTPEEHDTKVGGKRGEEIP